ncbi:CPBP family intramembrane glutamic endopeptidase [Hyphomicrobium methylovorum]|uniref:CPBP family intramembrane glutamic endopeptidase n=1 Tax=Hyphomicrobium methylovorum TaxID=84 RepID=UPI001AEE9546|nr:CPBP family intramembrane glutamic endopeptidase [Hyphomicrobium methylovorum]
MNLFAGQRQEPGERAGWKPVVAVFVITAAIIVLATAAGFGAAKLFDIVSRLDEPRAFRAGEPEFLLTARVAASLFGFQAVTVLLVFFADARLRASGRSLLPFGMPKEGIRTLVLSVIALMALAALIGASTYAFDGDAVRQDLEPFVGLMGTGAWWLMLIAAGIGAPLAEELLFRGLLYAVLRRSVFGFLGTALVTSVLWASLHANYSIYGVIAVLVIGIYLAFLRERTGTLVAPMVAHGVYNSLIVLILAFWPSWLIG